MANTSTIKLEVILSATDKMSRIIDNAIKDATKDLTAFGQKTAEIGDAIAKVGTKMTAVGMSVGKSLVNLATSAANYSSEIVNQAQSVGMSTDAWQKLTYAARVSGVGQSELMASMIEFDNVIVAAASGNKDAAATFRELGIDIKNASGELRAPEEILADFADILGSVEDGAAKTALVTEVLGQAGASILPALNKGSKGLEEFYAAAEEAGYVLSDKTLKAGNEFGKKLNEIGANVKAAGLQLGSAFIPLLSGLANKFNTVIKSLSKWIEDNPVLVKTIGAIVGTLSGLLIAAGSVAVVIGTVMSIAGKFAAAWRGIKTVITIVKLLNTAILANPILLIATIAATAVFLIIKYWDQISAFFTKLWDGIKAGVLVAWEWIKNMFLNYTPYGLIIKHWSSITTFFSGIWDNVKSGFLVAWEWIKNMFLNYTPYGLIFQHWDAIGSYFADMKSRFFTWGQDMIQGLIDGITGFAQNAIDTISNIGQSIADKFKNLLGINSPSTLFMGYGVNISQGLVNGMDQGGSGVEGSAEGMASMATQGMSNAIGDGAGMPGIGAGGGVTLNYSPSISVNGAAGPEAAQDFDQILRAHSREIVDIIRREMENRTRLSFS